MDSLLVSLLNTALERPDLLETPLGAARWWGSQDGRLALRQPGEKPRFDAAFSAALRAMREEIRTAASGSELRLPLAFRGGPSDAILFEVAYAARNAAARGDLQRIRVCRLQACGRYFGDGTKNGSQRWCSLRCMERARAPRRRTISA